MITSHPAVALRDLTVALSVISTVAAMIVAGANTDIGGLQPRAAPLGVAPAPRTAPVAAKSVSQTELSDAAKLYINVCASCHQNDGKGIPQAFPPLAASHWVTGDRRYAAAIVLKGMHSEITVRGVVYNGVMPGLEDQLSDAEIATILTYVRGAWGNDAEPVAEDTVTRVREKLENTGPLVGAEAVRRCVLGDAEGCMPLM